MITIIKTFKIQTFQRIFLTFFGMFFFPIIIVNGENIIPQEFEYSKEKIEIPKKYKKEKVKIHKDTTIIVSKEIELSYELDKNSWFAFDNSWEYKHDSVECNENSLEVLARILIRESTSNDNIDKIIDQYLVIVTGLRTIQAKYNNNANQFVAAIKSGKCSLFSYPTKSKKATPERLILAKKIVLDVLNCDIPLFVPYLPYGIINYWNSGCDTNSKQKRWLQKDGAITASTTKGHHFFNIVKTMSDYTEIEHLRKISCSNKISKNISNGKFCK